MDRIGSGHFINLSFLTMQQHLLSLIVFLPLASACIMLFLPREGYDRFRIITLLFNALNMALLGLLAYAHAHGFSAEINTSWFSIASGNGTVFSANYHLRTDGLSLPLLLLTGVVMFIATLAFQAWPSEGAQVRWKPAWMGVGRTLMSLLDWDRELVAVGHQPESPGAWLEVVRGGRQIGRAHV